LPLDRLAFPSRVGSQRLDRFAVAMAYPTLTETAHALGVSAAALIEQLQRLERDGGTQLFYRATPASQPAATPDPTRRRTPGTPTVGSVPADSLVFTDTGQDVTGVVNGLDFLDLTDAVTTGFTIGPPLADPRTGPTPTL